MFLIQCRVQTLLKGVLLMGKAIPGLTFLGIIVLIGLVLALFFKGLPVDTKSLESKLDAVGEKITKVSGPAAGPSGATIPVSSEIVSGERRNFADSHKKAAGDGYAHGLKKAGVRVLTREEILKMADEAVNALPK